MLPEAVTRFICVTLRAVATLWAAGVIDGGLIQRELPPYGVLLRNRRTTQVCNNIRIYF